MSTKRSGSLMTVLLMVLLAACGGANGGANSGANSSAERTATPITEATGEAAALDVGDAQRGAALFEQSIGGAPACSTCHLPTDERRVGPGLAGVGSRAAERVPGQSAQDYLYTSITQPGAHVVEGYVNVMPGNYAEVLSQQQIADLIAFLLSLEEAGE
ncbi:MAG: c-type cytochrome [bacterium]|nr:c-type cytochrome [bacterium]